MRFIIRVVINAFAIWVVTLIPTLQASVTPFPPGHFLQWAVTRLLGAALCALVNTVIGTVIKIVAFPLYILTLGLMSLIVNGFLLWLTSVINGAFNFGLHVESFWWGVVAALVISIINWFFGIFLRPQTKKRRR